MAGPQFWSGRRVVVTGHTGFKGTWLASWLAELGAEVTGIAQPPATEPSLFAASGLGARDPQPDRRCPLTRPPGPPFARGTARGPVSSGRPSAGHSKPGRPGNHAADEHPGRGQSPRGGTSPALA